MNVRRLSPACPPFVSRLSLRFALHFGGANRVIRQSSLLRHPRTNGHPVLADTRFPALDVMQEASVDSSQPCAV